MKAADKVLVVADKKEITLDGVQAIKLAHDLMSAGEKALKQAGKWKGA